MLEPANCPPDSCHIARMTVCMVPCCCSTLCHTHGKHYMSSCVLCIIPRRIPCRYICLSALLYTAICFALHDMGWLGILNLSFCIHNIEYVASPDIQGRVPAWRKVPFCVCACERFLLCIWHKGVAFLHKGKHLAIYG